MAKKDEKINRIIADEGMANIIFQKIREKNVCYIQLFRIHVLMKQKVDETISISHDDTSWLPLEYLCLPTDTKDGK